MEYPKPQNGSKRGAHWTASNYPAHANFQWHLDWMVRCKIGWVKYVADGNASPGQGDSGLQFGMEVFRRGMVPVHRFYLPADHRWTDANSYAVEACVKNNIRYIEPMNEPDLLRVEWGTPPPLDGWLERSFSTWMDQARRILDLGGIPLSPALASGVFQDRGPDAGQIKVNPFVWAREAGIEDFVCAIHNYVGNHPIDYPYDEVNQSGKPLTQDEYDKYGPAAWDHRSIESINEQRARDKNPGDTIRDDDSCFLAVVLFRELLEEAGLQHVPTLTTEGGPVYSDLWDGRYPRVVPGLYTEMFEQELQWMADKVWYLGLCPWLWANGAAGGTGGWSENQLYHPGHPWVDSDGFMPVIKWMVDRPLSEDGIVDPPEPPEPEPPPPEPEPPPPQTYPENKRVNEGQDLGVQVAHAPGVPEGEGYWRCILVRRLTASENRGNHNVYVRAFRGGERAMGVRGTVLKDREWPFFLNKSDADWAHGDVPLFKHDNASVWLAVPGAESDVVAGLSTDHMIHEYFHENGKQFLGNSRFHISWLLVFEWATKGGVQPDPEPEPPPPAGTQINDYVREKAWSDAGIRRFAGAALTRAAARRDSGAPINNEVYGTFNGRTIVVQGFAKEILYVYPDDITRIHAVPWQVYRPG